MRIAILSGGKNKKIISEESGHNVYKDLDNFAKEIHHIKISEDGTWSRSGIKTSLHKILPFVDHVIDMTHASIPEADKNFIRNLNFKKVLHDNPDLDFVRKLAFQLGIKSPAHTKLDREGDIGKSLHSIWRKIHMPVYVKCEDHKSDTLVSSHQIEIIDHINHIHSKNSKVIFDSHIRGDKYSVITISKFRRSDIYSSPIYIKNKISNKVNLFKTSDEDFKNELLKMSELLHSHLGYKLLKQDYVHNGKDFYLVNVEAKPSYKEGSTFHKIFTDSGITFAEVVKSLEQI